MNKHRVRFSIAIRFCPIALLTILSAFARAQSADVARASTDETNTSGKAFSCCPDFLFAASRLPTETSRSRGNIDNAVREFVRAWNISGQGTTGREGVVLIYRMDDGSYTGELQRFTNEYGKATFAWKPGIVAIVHTHPNKADPKPADQDKFVAEKYGIPNFTITIDGMYLYDPATKKTIKVLNGLDWLRLSAYPEEFRRWIEPRRLAPSSF
jgi:hypothetical protein